MSLVVDLERMLRAAGPPQVLVDPAKCRREMRLWALRWAHHKGQKDQFELAELCLGNALGWRDRSTWADVL